MSEFTPPSGPVEWLVICHRSLKENVDQRKVWAQTAFQAAALCGLQLSECIVQQVTPTLASKP